MQQSENWYSVQKVDQQPCSPKWPQSSTHTIVQISDWSHLSLHMDLLDALYKAATIWKPAVIDYAEVSCFSPFYCAYYTKIFWKWSRSGVWMTIAHRSFVAHGEPQLGTKRTPNLKWASVGYCWSPHCTWLTFVTSIIVPRSWLHVFSAFPWTLF